VKGADNPNWKGGISRDHMHYKRLQKQRYPERVRARELVRRALRAGRLKRGSADTNAHHEDYSKPLVVGWFCRDHHGGEHDEHPHPRNFGPGVKTFVWRGKERPR
jgi:hypothetical protein